MIGHQRPGVNCRFRTDRKFSHARDKVFTICNIINYPAFVDPSQYYVMQGSRRIQSRSSRHRFSPFSCFYTSHKIL